MDADQIRRLRPELTRYLGRFADCVSQQRTHAYLSTYVEGQLSDLPEKSCEPIALAAGIPPRNLQEFLAHYQWNEDRARDRLQEIVIAEHGGPHTIGIIDETSDVKKGNKTPGVKRQWCGTVGKTENCIVTVHLGYAQDDFHCLLDGELFLPEDWAADRPRCRAAGIPDDVTYRPKWRIALDLLDRAKANGVTLDWLTVDEGYGGKPPFLRETDARGQWFVAEVPTDFSGWIREPRVTERPFRRKKGRRRGRARARKTPRLTAGSSKPITVANMLQYSPALRDQPWVKYHVKDGEKGPVVWEVKHTRITIKDENGLPGMRLHLVVARNVLDPTEIKFFVSNAPEDTSVETLLLVAFSRWRVERCFEDGKQEVGLDQWEGRLWLGLKRHLILTSISYLFLARVRKRLGEKKSGADGLPGAHRRRRTGAKLVAQRPRLDKADRAHRLGYPTLATTKHRRPREPHADNAGKTW